MENNNYTFIKIFKYTGQAKRRNLKCFTFTFCLEKRITINEKFAYLTKTVLKTTSNVIFEKNEVGR